MFFCKSGFWGKDLKNVAEKVKEIKWAALWEKNKEIPMSLAVYTGKL